MTVMFFDSNEQRIADVNTILSCVHTISQVEDTVSLVGVGIPEAAAYLGFFDRSNDLQVFEIKKREEDKVTHEIILYAENAFYELATDEPINDVRPTNTTAGIAATQALTNTRFKLGNAIGTAQASTRWYFISPYAALRDIESVWAVRAKARYEVKGARITGRFIDLVSSIPTWRGKRYEIGKDIMQAVYIQDSRNIATALIGRGKGEESGDGYGRKITFEDIEWSIANGDPANKPTGQNWVEDTAATALYGVHGTRPRFAIIDFPDIEDAGELLSATWEALGAACEPSISATLVVCDLERMGFPHEAARFGDEVAFIIGDRRARAQIIGIKREYAKDGQDVIQFGAPAESMVSRLGNIQRSLTKTEQKANIGAMLAEQNKSLLSGYIDTMVTRILSTGTTMYTDPIDGGLVLETPSGNEAVKLTGRGILIASEKTGDTWQWSLAMDGKGMVAEAITTGVLNASLVKILGTDRFYWDAGNIHIINPEDEQQQIRIGLFDGTQNGIGFTKDSGATWQTAIGFNGIQLGADSVSKYMLSGGLVNELNTFGDGLARLENRIDSTMTQDEFLAAMAQKVDLSSIVNLADIQTVEAIMQSYIVQSEASITNKFQETYTYTVAVDGRLEEFKAFVESYQRFTAAGLELGATNSAFKAMLSNTRLSFTQNGAEIAYISNNKMYITDAEITSRLTIGNYDLFKMQDGSLAFQWNK